MVRFTTKKIDTLTLGEEMKKLRGERRLTLNDVSKGTRIQMKYLQYLEEGDYAKLPAEVYVKGFLRSYCAYFGLNEKSILKQYERERGIHRSIKKTDHASKEREYSSTGWVVTPKVMMAGGITISVLAGIFYLYHEVNSFVSTPRLVLLAPNDGATIEGKTAHVSGVAEKDSFISINGQSVMANEKGEFSEDVILQGGLNMITVKARNRFDKETTQSVSVNASFDSPVNPADGSFAQGGDFAAAPFSMEVEVRPDPTWVSVEADGSLVYSGVMSPGDVQRFEAREKVVISSGVANGTYVKMGSAEPQALGGEAVTIKNVSFSAEGKIEQGETVVGNSATIADPSNAAENDSGKEEPASEEQPKTKKKK